MHVGGGSGWTGKRKYVGLRGGLAVDPFSNGQQTRGPCNPLWIKPGPHAENRALLQ